MRVIKGLLGALVANLVEADLLVILTDRDGMYDADPRHNPDAELIYEARADDPALDGVAGGVGGALGGGGMAAKLRGRAPRRGVCAARPHPPAPPPPPRPGHPARDRRRAPRKSARHRGYAADRRYTYRRGR